MKISKNKRNKKIVEFYKTLNNLIEPFKVLIDGSFVFAALKNRIRIKQLLSEALGYNITPVTTNCILNELKDMGEDLSGAVTVIKHFQNVITMNRITLTQGDVFYLLFLMINFLLLPKILLLLNGLVFKCCFGTIYHSIIFSRLSSSFIYFQQNLAYHYFMIWKLEGVPIIRIIDNLIHLEKPSHNTLDQKQKVEESKRLPKNWEQSLLSSNNTSKHTNTKYIYNLSNTSNNTLYLSYNFII
ncbi:uncharacterized protein TA18665 [Theileria annulata]|uniref:Uncharacterized protein n=1 Tax=Theileria annulata TaxID=5874 RepID=Q4UBF5_THEAN|nr:uncharacterized protein TA18665 [Theileria annulata]CAI75846.1 hypothetical protein TA18665 [Theileria annulata]|eukprot:XP_955322.1 hypothetical protein TA18665 [Theileria annulata]